MLIKDTFADISPLRRELGKTFLLPVGNLGYVIVLIKTISGNSLVVQWLGLSAFTAGSWVRSLVGGAGI